jgi:hypothetical protein
MEEAKQYFNPPDGVLTGLRRGSLHIFSGGRKKYFGVALARI